MAEEAPALLLWGVPEWHAAAPLVFNGERRFQLLAVLALESGRWVERDRLAALLWPEREATAARRNLRKVVFDTVALPGLDGPGGLQTQAHALRWDVHSDVAAFEAQRQPDPVAALAWRRGLPLQGLDDVRNAAWTEWLAATRTRLEQAWLATALDHACAQPEPEARAAAARRVLAVDALDEAALSLLLKAEVACGRLPQAQAEFRRYALRLAQELGVEPSRTLREWMLAQGDAPASPAPAQPTPPAPAAQAMPPPPAEQLPTGATPFVGRKLELAELRGLLERPECRLVTLLGPGGVGKSRLAQQTLAALRARPAPLFPGGHLLLSLQAAASADELPGRWALALGLTLPERAEPLPALLRQWPPAGQRALLVLDNVEHLDGLPALLQQALDAAPALTVMCTSRSRLALPAEWVLPVPGLALPDEESLDLEAAASFDAVQLFVRCAALARRDFMLAPHLGAVLDIVNAVGGLPLAIELAASWVRLLPPEQIAADLQQGIEVLERDPSGPAPARPEHGSLRAVLDGSWQLLGPREREALGALSVFRGGFTRAAALAVAGCSLPLLSALVDKSLLAVDETGRFALHPVLAAYSAERGLAEPARAVALRARHAEFHARLLAELAPHRRLELRRLVDTVAAEYANLRAAWQHAVQQQHAGWLGAMAPAWAAFHEQRSRLREGVDLMRPALAALSQADPKAVPALARIRLGLAVLLQRQGDLQEALAVAQQGVVLAQDSGERDTLHGCLCKLGETLWNLGRSDDALAPLERALALAREDGRPDAIAQSLALLAVAEKALGRFDIAMARQQQALALQRELGDLAGVAQRLNQIGNLYRSLHRWREAADTLGEGLAMCRLQGIAGPQRLLRLNLALTQLELDELDSARALFEGLLPELREAGLVVMVLGVELGLARLSVMQKDLPQAVERLQRVLVLARAKSFNNHPAVVASIYGEVLLARGERMAAALAWRSTSTLAASDEMDRQGALTLLERMALSDTERAALDAARPPTLDQLLTRLQAEPPWATARGEALRHPAEKRRRNATPPKMGEQVAIPAA